MMSSTSVDLGLQRHGHCSHETYLMTPYAASVRFLLLVGLQSFRCSARARNLNEFRFSHRFSEFDPSYFHPCAGISRVSIPPELAAVQRSRRQLTCSQAQHGRRREQPTFISLFLSMTPSASLLVFGQKTATASPGNLPRFHRNLRSPRHTNFDCSLTTTSTTTSTVTSLWAFAGSDLTSKRGVAV